MRGDGRVDAQKPGDPAGRRGVEHDRVVDEPLVRATAPGRLIGLAGQQYVTHTGRDRGRELDHAHPVQRPAGPTQPVVQVEVLVHGLRGVDGEPEHVAALPSDSQLSLLNMAAAATSNSWASPVALRPPREGLVAARPPSQRESRGHRRLPRTALSGDTWSRTPSQSPTSPSVGERSTGAEMTSWWLRQLDCPNGGTPRCYRSAKTPTGRSTQSATYRRKPPAAPPSQTRWSKVSDSWVTLRTASSPVDDPGLVDDPADAERAPPRGG